MSEIEKLEEKIYQLEYKIDDLKDKIRELTEIVEILKSNFIYHESHHPCETPPSSY